MTGLRRKTNMNGKSGKPPADPDRAAARASPGLTGGLPGPVVLIGLMGAGKSKVGRSLAKRLGVGFVDNDVAVEEAAGMDIPAIFDAYGEEAFRDLEAKVLAGILTGPARVVATGGGAYMDPKTRSLIGEMALSLWLKADAATLAGRISNPDSRPLLRGRDPARVLAGLAAERYPVYAGADLTVDTDGLSLNAAVVKVEKELLRYLKDSGTGTRR